MGRWADGLEAAAAERLPEAVHRYFRQGARDGISAAEAEQAWLDTRLRPRVLRDVSRLHTGTTLLGTPIDAPIAVAPSSLQMQAHPRGELEMAAGVAAASTLLCVSSNAGSTFADVAAQGAPWWLQAYVLRDRSRTVSMLERAVAAGAGAVVLTLDTPVVAAKYDVGETVWETTPVHYLHVNEDLADTSHLDIAKAADLTPDDIGWLADHTGLPVVVKGVLRADDACTAVSAGAAAVWVSNHGGRQLDGAVSTRQALPEVAAAVEGRAEVYVDGGVRRGLDVLAARALGARAVFVGRPALWALTVGGAAGVRRLMAELTGELSEAMMLCGTPSVEDVPGDLVAAFVRTTPV